MSTVIRERPESSVEEAHRLGAVRASPFPNPRSADYRKRISLLAVSRGLDGPSSSSSAGPTVLPVPKAKPKAKPRAKVKAKAKKKRVVLFCNVCIVYVYP